MKRNTKTRPILACAAAVLSSGATGVLATPFTITDGQRLTRAQTLTDGQVGVIKNGGALALGPGDDHVAITVSGQVRVDNAGVIRQSGSERAIENDGDELSLRVDNRAGGVIQTRDKDVIKLDDENAVSLRNSGRIISRNVSKGGAQAIDFNDVSSARNRLTNSPGATIEAFEADGVRPGRNGRVDNGGTIRARNAAGSDASSDGIDAQQNSGVVIDNRAGTDAAGPSRIAGARHGITGGNEDSTTNGAYSLRVTNGPRGVIRGGDGSGVNIDGFNANERVTVNNRGRIVGRGATGDGDGVDVDGLVDLNNTGTVVSKKAFEDISEGVSVGGGTIVNTGTIQGANVNGGVGRGITLSGLDSDPDTDEPIPTQGIFADTTIDNGGTISGTGGAAIALPGADSGFSLVLTNRGDGLIRGGSDREAAISTGATTARIVNAGTIKASAGARAIDLGTGDSSLAVRGGRAVVAGDIDGGGGTDTVRFAPGAGQRLTYADSLANVDRLTIDAGTTVLNGRSRSVDATRVRAGRLTVGSRAGSNASLPGPISVADGATLGGRGAVGPTTVETGAALAPGAPTGALRVAGDLALDGALNIDLAGPKAFDRLEVAGVARFGPGSTLAVDARPTAGFAVGQSFDVLVADAFGRLANLGLRGLDFGSGLGVDATSVALDDAGRRALRLTVARRSAVPAPGPGGLALALLGLALIGGLRRRRDRNRPVFNPGVTRRR